MGTPIGDLLTKEEITLGNLKNKTLGVDAHNIIYQFLTTIRDLNGEYLTNSQGRVTSHIIGLFYRLTKLLEENINLVFVFDGKSLELKRQTLEKRKETKILAEEKSKQKFEEGELEESAKLKRRSAKIDDEMIKDAKEILDAFNIQHIDALSDGEAQLAVMNSKHQIDGVISQDYDTLLFGGKIVYRNITISGKKKAQGKDYYVQIKPEKIDLEENLRLLQITRDKLIWLGIMIGTDFNEKVPKVGPKTALKLVQTHNSLEDIFKELEYIPNYDPEEIFNIFDKPLCKNIEIKKPTIPNYAGLKDLLISKYEFSEERVNTTLNALEKKLHETKAQTTLGGWF